MKTPEFPTTEHLRQAAIDHSGLFDSGAEGQPRITHTSDIYYRLSGAGRQQFAQALSNLLSNAIKFSPQGYDVVITSKDAGSYLKIKVTDQGT